MRKSPMGVKVDRARADGRARAHALIFKIGQNCTTYNMHTQGSLYQIPVPRTAGRSIIWNLDAGIPLFPLHLELDPPSSIAPLALLIQLVPDLPTEPRALLQNLFAFLGRGRETLPGAKHRPAHALASQNRHLCRKPAHSGNILPAGRASR